MAKPTILLYNFADAKRKNKISAFCAMNGIRARVVKEAEYTLPLYQLAGMEEPEGEKPEKTSEEENYDPAEKPVTEEMLVLCGLGSKLNTLLGFLRKEKIYVNLKAALTQTNQYWDSRRLYSEITEEHEMMHR